MEVAANVYRLVQDLPDVEKFGIRSQLCRAAVSISSNIAEGHGRGSNADFARFLRISMGSLREVQSLLALATILHLLPESEDTEQLLDRTARMLYGLIKHLGG